MATFVMIEDKAYTLNTEAEVQQAREALREAGLEYADEWAGEPDDTNDAYKNGSKLFAAKANMATYQIDAHDTEASGDWMDLCVSAIPGEQDSGRVNFRCEVEPTKVAAFEAALESDDNVIAYEAQ